MFLVEAKQAGIFEIRNMPAGADGPIMGIACPQIVYPYLRANVADIVTRAGFPPVHAGRNQLPGHVRAQQQAQVQRRAAGQRLGHRHQRQLRRRPRTRRTR